MPLNIYDTATMLRGVEAAKKTPSFLRDTFFPTSAGDIFTSKKVMVDYEEDTSEKLAPAVITGDVPVQRGNFTTEEYTAPLIAPSRTLSVEQLNDRSFNEDIFGGMTPAQREATYLARDISDLEKMIVRTEEYMAAKLLTENTYTIKQYINRFNSGWEDFTVSFFGEGNATNQAVYTPDADWDAVGGDILKDIAAMCKSLKNRGLPADIAILGSDAADIFLNDEKILKLLDNRRVNLSDTLDPAELPNGTTRIGRFNAYGHMVDVYAYTAQYTSDAGVSTYYLPAGICVVTAKNIGRTAYGAVTQIEEGSTDPVTYAARRVPHVLVDRRDGVKTLVLQSRPLLMPKHINPYISAVVTH